MEGMDIYTFITSILTLICGGGWFINWRAKKRKENAEAKQTEVEGNKQAQEYYNKALEDANHTIQEVRADRDHYKEDRNILRKENEEMRKQYYDLEKKINTMDISYKKEMARLGRRLECLSPFLCGVAGCLHRKKVNLMEDIDDSSFSTEEERNQNDIEPSNEL